MSGMCGEVSDTIVVEGRENDLSCTTDVKLSKEFIRYPIHTIFLAGTGGGYFDNPGYKTFTVTFFAAHLWEVWKYAAIRAAGEVFTIFGDALSADLTAGVNVYPFQYGMTPYLGVEAGYGYGQVDGMSDYGFNVSAEIGVFALKIRDALLGGSVRGSLMQSVLTDRYSSGVSIRFGFLL
jgi:hypothetical protein